MQPKYALSSSVPGLAAWLCFGLLIPLTRALSEGGFGFLDTSAAFGWIAHLVPDGQRDDRTLVKIGRAHV